MQEILVAAVISFITYTVYRLFELFVRRGERMAIIEKFSVGLDPEALKDQLKLSFYQSKVRDTWSIRVGLLLLGIGLGVLIAIIINLAILPTLSIYDSNTMEYNNCRNTLDILYPSCAAVFGGVGLILAYFVERKNK